MKPLIFILSYNAERAVGPRPRSSSTLHSLPGERFRRFPLALDSFPAESESGESGK